MSLNRPPTASDPEAITIPAGVIRREVWRSLVSMLRVYASLETLGAETGDQQAAHIDVVEEGSLLLELNRRTLKLYIQFEDGFGCWAAAEEAGDFELTEAGALRVDGQPKELDVAAIEWLEQLRPKKLAPNKLAK